MSSSASFEERPVENRYSEATDCPICAMLATDRDDALNDANELRDEVEALRTMIDHPEVLAMLAGPGGSTCTKVIGDNESEWYRRHWRNALDQWRWWQERYAAATGDGRPRTQIEVEERRHA